MILVWDRKRLRWKRFSGVLSVAPHDSSLSLKSEFFKQLVRPSEAKPPVTIILIATTNVSKYFKDDLQKIFKTVLKGQALALTSAPTPAPAVIEVFCNKLKARFLDIYCGKSDMDCYNFCQQCENHFAPV